MIANDRKSAGIALGSLQQPLLLLLLLQGNGEAKGKPPTHCLVPSQKETSN